MRSLDHHAASAYRVAIEVVRIIDGDEHSLGARVARALAVLPPGCTVLRFTYWYTGRRPVHEAVVRRPA